MEKALRYIFTALIFTGYLSCKKPFNAKLTSTATGILTVDGPIISGDSTFLTLSRTTALNDTTQNKPELKAILSVEDDQGKLYPFTETGQGNYVMGVTNFSTARQFRLDIKTSDGNIYQSDFVPMKITPPIDSVYFRETSDAQVLFYANTHDPTNNTRYYRWDYKETWRYTSYLDGSIGYVYSNNNLIAAPLYVGHCYGMDNSNQIIIGSSARLSNDIITGQQIGGLAANSRKIADVYNMRLYQYALTQEGFNYYQNLRTNTEETGSIFDAQPSTTTGNIHCISSPTMQVIGFISVSTVTANIFSLTYSQLPLRVQSVQPADFQMDPNALTYYVGPPEPANCVGPTYTITANIPPNVFQPNGVLTITEPAYGGTLLIDPAGTFSARLNALLAGTKFPIVFTGPLNISTNGIITTLGYNYYKADCVDCLLLEPNATLTRPSYFPP